MQSMGNRVPLPHLLLRVSRGKGDVMEEAIFPGMKTQSVAKLGLKRPDFSNEGLVKDWQGDWFQYPSVWGYQKDHREPWCGQAAGHARDAREPA